MELETILHGERLCKSFPVACNKPIFIVLNFRIVVILSMDKVTQSINDQIFGQPVQVTLCRVLDPMTLPVIVCACLDDLILMVNTLRKELLYAFIFREGDVRSVVEDKTAVVLVRCGKATMIRFLLV